MLSYCVCVLRLGSRVGVHQVTVLINDTMGVLAAGRYRSPDAMIGLILGTGVLPQHISTRQFNSILPPLLTSATCSQLYQD